MMLKNYSDKLDEVSSKILSILENILEANQKILLGLKSKNDELLNSAKDNLRNMNSKTSQIDNLVIKIFALYSPEAKDLRTAISFFKMTNELLRASSNTKAFISGLNNYHLEVDEKSINDFAIPMQESTVECLNLIIKMMNSASNDEAQDLYNKIQIFEEKTDEYYELLQDIIYKNALGIEKFGKFSKILRAFRKSEKIADRALDIATLLYFAKVGGELGIIE
jgi:phosphate transport system protein